MLKRFKEYEKEMLIRCNKNDLIEAIAILSTINA